nr:M20/M25/M40 family metallo-hydrolase [Brevibacillus sp. SYP-B805]
MESVVNTPGEAALARRLFDELKTWPYFQKHPEHLWLQPTGESAYQRYNVIALVKADQQIKETTMLLGHIDTVGTDDYGQWKEVATHPDVLRKVLQEQAHLPAAVKRHLDEGDWMFGRGTSDMKSGVAANLAVLKYYSEHTAAMNGNLILVAECDEEDSSNGILAAVPFLNRLAEEQGIAITAAINSDFVTARHEGDPNRYIYLGTVGKLLPSVYVSGNETHVGQAFDGFDPNLLLAEITREIDYNPELCDEMYGEVTPPPVSLKQTDLKPYYDVQTPLAGFAYYNFLVHSLSPRDVLELLRARAEKAFERAIETYRNRYQAYCERTGTAAKPVRLTPRVYTYSEYYDYLRGQHGDSLAEAMARKAEELMQDQSLDIRWFCCRLVEELHRYDPNKDPVCILFYSSLYSPRVALSDDDPRDRRLQEAVEHAVQQVQPHYRHPIVIRRFFPYISDMSFVTLSDDADGIEGYTANMPAWGRRHHVPFEEIRRLQVPIVNIGPYGFDAHKKWERLECTYSLEMVPRLMHEVIEYLWKHPL